MAEHANPFKSGAGLDPPYLAGRRAEFEEFSLMLRDVRNGAVRNMAVHGLRGVGKTVLLTKFGRMCKDENFLPVSEPRYSAEQSDPAEFVGLFKYNLRSAIETFSKLERTKSKIQSVVHYIKPASVGVQGIMYYEPAYEPDQHMPMRNHMTDYLIKNWKVIEKGGYDGAVFLFDEFHTIRDSNGKRFVLANFIGALDEAQKKGCRYAAVLCGLPILQNNLKEARSYSERMFKSLQVSMLEESDAKRAMTKPLECTKRKFSSALLSEIVEDTNCYPYFVQFYAKEILDRVDKDSIGVEDYRKVKGAIVDVLDRDFFDQRMEQLNNSQRAALYAMAGVQDADITFAAVKKLASINKGTFTKNLARLEEKGHIHKARHGVYRFSLPMFREYLRRKGPGGSGSERVG